MSPSPSKRALLSVSRSIANCIALRTRTSSKGAWGLRTEARSDCTARVPPAAAARAPLGAVRSWIRRQRSIARNVRPGVRGQLSGIVPASAGPCGRARRRGRLPRRPVSRRRAAAGRAGRVARRRPCSGSTPPATGVTVGARCHYPDSLATVGKHERLSGAQSLDEVTGVLLQRLCGDHSHCTHFRHATAAAKWTPEYGTPHRRSLGMRFVFLAPRNDSASIV